MNKPLFHVFRNTPFGRETLLQSAYFCSRLNMPLAIYQPESKSFLLYFDRDVVQVDLDGSYLTDPASAEEHIREVLAPYRIKHSLVQPVSKSASTLPDLPVHFSLMTCPRSMSDDTRKIALGMIGSKVRRIVQSAHFPIFLPAPVFKPWNSLAVLYGGSDNAAAALRLALEIRRRSNTPLRIFSQGSRREFEVQMLDQGFSGELVASLDWTFWSAGDLVEQLYSIPHDSLVLLGAYGKGLIRDTLFGSTMEKVQSNLPNSMLVVGPKCDWIKTAAS
ncbi:MAG: universal stress protein UspA [Desulfuromonas sp.]|mgnify:CR=1 FL=1|nr:MAG: universal stress protein UspA [Desulfuromonas sp.]